MPHQQELIQSHPEVQTKTWLSTAEAVIGEILGTCSEIGQGSFFLGGLELLLKYFAGLGYFNAKHKGE